MSRKWPVQRGRTTSRSKMPAMGKALGLEADRVKWLPQNRTSRSKYGRPVDTATSMRAATAWA